jgi:hypothetical protein
MYNIYIYDFTELNNILLKKTVYYPPEMNIFDHFLYQIKNNYNIVSNLEEADIAFIPIDFIRLIYIFKECVFIEPNNYELPPYPDPLGSESKKNIISYYWKKYVDKYLIKTNIPHFILYSYVLFDIDFSDIPRNIFILAYENYISFSTLPMNNNKIDDRIIIIPYILNENVHFNQPKIINYYYHNNDNDNEILNEKIYDIGYFGCNIHDSSKVRTPYLYKYREFLKYYNINNEINYIVDEGDKACDNLYKLKYLFVLRGDTPTRVCFYQCFAYGVCPIIYEKDFNDIYSKILLPNDIHIEDSLLILPDIEKYENTEKYCNIVDEIIKNELSNDMNYINKIKNHKLIFDHLNYFKTPICNPIQNVINHLVNNNVI